MKVWVPEDGVRRLENLPEGVEVEVFPSGGSFDGDALGVRFVVPPLGLPSEAPDILAGLPDLEVVQTFSAGVDWILPHVPPGATLCDARGFHDISVSEWAAAAILAMKKDFPKYRDFQRESQWNHAAGEDLEGSNVLIVGHGFIGEAVEKRLEPFDVEIARVARTERAGVHAIADLPDLLPRADVVVLLLPLTDETEGLFDGELFGRMRDGAIFVNAARGAIVDTGALRKELVSGRIRAALDTTEPEPLTGDHPLWDAPGVFITPHVAGDTRKFPERAYRLIGAQISRFASGEPLHNVVHENY
ncbi:2-hydroxyacid dehydrogenase [soil metagenome]